jgi:hypothetical protein
MKQSELINLLRDTADQVGQCFCIEKNRGGIHLSTNAGSINLGSDMRAEVHRRYLGRYLKSLGLHDSHPN